MRLPERGFTLVEMLVAVSLLAVIMVALGSSLRTVAQTESRVDQHLGRIDEMRVSVALMRQLIARVSGHKLQAGDSGSGQVVQFRASSSMIEWLGVMPARPGVGGRHYFRLAMENDAGGEPQLVLRFVPWQPGVRDVPDWRTSDSRVLVHHMTHFSVQAEGRPQAGTPALSWPQGWVEGWPVANQLPERVRLHISDINGAWPPTVIGIVPLLQGAGSGGGFTVGGGAS